MCVAVLVLLAVCPVATAAEPRIDPVVAAAWGWTQTAPPVTPDPRGEWAPWWDGRVWQPRWIPRQEVGVAKPPKAPATSGSANPTDARGVVPGWDTSAATFPTGNTFTPTVMFRGATGEVCPTGQP